MGRLTRLSVAFPLGCSLASFTLLILILVAGLNYRTGSEPRRYFAIIDASKLEARASGNSSYGLPDPYDAFKPKAFFSVYLWTYCSGTKQGSLYSVDFCSNPRVLIYDLSTQWYNWARSVKLENLTFSWLHHNLRALGVGYIISACLNFLQGVAIAFSVASKWSGRIAILFSFLTALCILTTSAIAQSQFLSFASHVREESSDITARLDRSIYIFTWFAFGITLVGSIVLSFMIRYAGSNELLSELSSPTVGHRLFDFGRKTHEANESRAQLLPDQSKQGEGGVEP